MIIRSVVKAIPQVLIAWLCAGFSWIIVQRCIEAVEQGRYGSLILLMITSFVYWIIARIFIDNPQIR
jgi:hypothetical protein